MIKSIVMAAGLALAGVVPADDGCSSRDSTPVSASGLNKATVKVPTDEHGLSVEQENVSKRLLIDNKPGAIKYLYILSQYTGDVLIFSTVKGKVTSGNKRLTPSSITSNGRTSWCTGFVVQWGDDTYCTNEVLGDDGTYGSSGEYIFWFDAKGNYHQQGTNGALWHVSDTPLPIHHVVINIDNTADHQDAPEAPEPAPAKTGKR